MANGGLTAVLNKQHTILRISKVRHFSLKRLQCGDGDYIFLTSSWLQLMLVDLSIFRFIASAMIDMRT